MKAVLLFLPLFVLIVPAAGAAHTDLPGLRYTADIAMPVPIPPAERGLQTITAQAWVKVSDKGLQLEGAVFDRAGNLHFVDIFGGRIWSVAPDGQVKPLIPENKRGAAGLAVHRDGRIFVAGLGNLKDTGSVFAVQPDGTGMTTIVPETAGYLVDDLVFDAKGGFYFTDFHGSSTDPKGGVYYVSPDFKTTTRVLGNLGVANGVALSPDGKVLWVDEFSRGVLHRVELDGATGIVPYASSIVYHFTGPAPDSMRVDADGNVYVAMYGQGRILVFNATGIPIGQILIPGRESGHNMRSTSMAFKPDTKDLYILSSDGMAGTQGCTIYRAGGFAKAAVLYSHQ